MTHDPRMSVCEPKNFSRPQRTQRYPPKPTRAHPRQHRQLSNASYPQAGFTHQGNRPRAEVIASRPQVKLSAPRPNTQPTYSLFPHERSSKREAQFKAEMLDLQVQQAVNVRAKLRAMPQPPSVEPQYTGTKRLQRNTCREEEAGCCVVM